MYLEPDNFLPINDAARNTDDGQEGSGHIEKFASRLLSTIITDEPIRFQSKTIVKQENIFERLLPYVFGCCLLVVVGYCVHRGITRYRRYLKARCALKQDEAVEEQLKLVQNHEESLQRDQGEPLQIDSIPASSKPN